ncbi:hypothetical protein EDD21DRAFT_410132 [Dissophora ornata]|nr:hypothetical protein EDD21DRAFT_410132 [Dissophora ornata]
MGCLSFWRFVSAKKRYTPVYRKPPDRNTFLHALAGPTNKYRVDIQGSFYAIIRYAYANCTNLEFAHAIVLKNLKLRLKDHNVAILYFDGSLCEEKLSTQRRRQGIRSKAIDSASRRVAAFTERIASGARVRRRHFADIRRQLSKTFRWDPAARDGLVAFLRNNGWAVVQCETEADVKIAKDTIDGDIVISGDSDLFIYQNITVLWRPARNSGFQECKKSDVLSGLGLQSSQQLTALGVVSTNDYGHSVYGLECETNFKVIKCTEATWSDGSVEGAAVGPLSKITKHRFAPSLDDNGWSHAWDARRALHEEFLVIADRLLKLVGGSIGAKRKEENMVIIALGLGKFGSSARLSSLHTAFFWFFVQLLRSLGYIVVGIEEDEMAGHNMLSEEVEYDEDQKIEDASATKAKNRDKTNSNASPNKALKRRASEGLESEEVDQIKAILRKALRCKE